MKTLPRGTPPDRIRLQNYDNSFKNSNSVQNSLYLCDLLPDSMKLQLFSDRKIKHININGLTIEEEETIWNRLAVECDVVQNEGSWIALRNTDTTKSVTSDLELVYRRKTNKSIFGLSKFLPAGYPEGEVFFVLKEGCPGIERVAIFEAVMSIKAAPLSDRWNYYRDRWSRIGDMYECYGYGFFQSQNEDIGEHDASVRGCRFCSNVGAEWFSKDKAHAIPHALGNKSVYCLEECRECNHKFSYLEDNFIGLMDFRRAYFNIPRKDTEDVADILGFNFHITEDKDGNGGPRIVVAEDAVIGRDGNRWTFEFKHNKTVRDIDIFRSFVKMAVDLMPSDKLSHFCDTVQWLKGIDNDRYSRMLSNWPCFEADAIVSDKCIYKQPVVYLFFARPKAIENGAPLCTGVIFTADMAYRFAVPFDDLCRGVTKATVGRHEEILSEVLPYGWESIGFRSEDRAYPFAIRDIDVSKENIEVVGADDKRFGRKYGVKSMVRSFAGMCGPAEVVLFPASIAVRHASDVYAQMKRFAINFDIDRDTIEISNDIVLSASSGVFGQTVMKYSVVYMLAGLVDYIVFAGNSPFQVNEWLVREVIQKAMCVLRHKMPAPLRRFDFDGMCRGCIEDNMIKLTIRHGGKTYHIFSDYLLSPCLRLKAAQRW